MLPTGVQLSYTQAGAADGAAVLYFHGTPSCRLEAIGGLTELAGQLGLRIIAPDRPGCGESSFTRYTVRSYPAMMSAFLDALGIGQVSVVGVSGGGRYACSCAVAWRGRARAVALISSTASADLPGVRASWSRQDRQIYGLASRAPLAFRATLAKIARDVQRDPQAVRALFNDVSEPDRRTLEGPDLQGLLPRVMREAFRHGTRGVAWDYKQEARPWRVDLRSIDVPVDVWHGTEDTIVSPQQSRALSAAVPTTTLHLVDGEGHISLRMNRMAEIIERLR